VLAVAILQLYLKLRQRHLKIENATEALTV